MEIKQRFAFANDTIKVRFCCLAPNIYIYIYCCFFCPHIFRVFIFHSFPIVLPATLRYLFTFKIRWDLYYDYYRRQFGINTPRETYARHTNLSPCQKCAQWKTIQMHPNSHIRVFNIPSIVHFNNECLNSNGISDTL